MQTFHHLMMSRLDEAQKAGALLTPLHNRIRATLRAANMKGQVFDTPEELARAVERKAWGLARELRRA